MNKLIKTWKISAKAVYDAETLYMKNLGLSEEERTYTYSYLAKRQIEMIKESMPNKTKPIKEQLNDIQKEAWEYLEKVAETNEI